MSKKIAEMNKILNWMQELVSQLKELEDIRSGKKTDKSEDEYWTPYKLDYHSKEPDIDKRLYLMLDYYEAHHDVTLIKMFGGPEDIMLAMHIAVHYKRQNEYLKKYIANIEKQLGRQFSSAEEKRAFIADKNSRARTALSLVASSIVTVITIDGVKYVSYDEYKKVQNIARDVKNLEA